MIKCRQIQFNREVFLVMSKVRVKFQKFINQSLGMLNSNYKLKARSNKEDSASRRIRTEINENSKKISFYLNKIPLNENTRIANQPENQQPKKAKQIKSIITKNTQAASKLTTEPHDKQHIHSSQKLAIQKLFAGKKHVTTTSSLGLKKDTSNPASSGAARYTIEQKVGSGTFGTVYKARDKKTLEIVAIKKVFQDRKYKNRELEILKMVRHPNILQMKDHFFTYEGEKEYLNVVMDHYHCNLYEAICGFRKQGQIPRVVVKLLSYQMFRSLLYLKQTGIAHRDIKPQNILVNQNNWKLVICDFGSAKILQAGQPNIAYICSRCYRAPELIFGNTNYTSQIDMWSVGCVLAEMLLFQPLFRAQSNLDQLVEIIRVLGTPSESQVLQMNAEGQFKHKHLPKIQPRSWNKVFRKHQLGDSFVDLLSKVLTYSPYKRITPLEALSHPFFNQLRDQQTYTMLRENYNIPDLFDFRSTKQAKSLALQTLIPKWYDK